MAKKIFLLFSFIFILILVFSGLCLAQRGLEITYPEIPGLTRPTTVKAILPEYIKYIFGFALIIAGLIAFGAIIYGGVRYLTSAGSPSALGDAKDQIFSAILGLVILFCSYLILTTINPQLVGLTLVREPTTKGIIIFKDGYCPNTEEEVCLIDMSPPFSDIPCPGGCWDCGGFNIAPDESLYDKLASENRAMKIRTSVSNLRDFLAERQPDGSFVYEPEDRIYSIWFFESWRDITVQFFPEEDWGGDPLAFGVGGIEMEANTCYRISKDFSVKSIKLLPKPPGVYLCAEYNATHDGTYTECENPGDGPQCKGCQGKQMDLRSDLVALTPEFNDKTQGILMKNIYEVDGHGDIQYDQPILKYGAVLHKDIKFKGAAELFLEGEPDLSNRIDPAPGSYRTEEMKDGVSSVTVFTLAEEGTGEVIFYEEENYGGDYYRCNPKTGECCPYDTDGSSAGACISTPRCTRYGNEMNYTMCINDVVDAGIPNATQPPARKRGISSIKITGNYIVLLFDGPDFTKGDLLGGMGCTIFTGPKEDKDFKDDPIGRCWCGPFGWGCRPCLSSFIILPIR